ncbi:MAG: hypothetical protein AAF328_08165 [Planctomycetota bacterium]
MTRRRARELDDDALDLFLDAISNVFGGILFIALAVVVLLQFTVPTPDVVPLDPEAVVEPAQAAAMPEALEALMLLETLPGDGDLVIEAAELSDVIQSELQALARLQNAQAPLRAEAKQAETQSKEAQKDAAQVEQAWVEAQRELERLQSRPTQRVRAARFRPSAKQEVPLMVAAGRVIRPMTAEGSANPAVLRIDAETQTARPAPGAGTAIEMGQAGDAALTRLLASLDAQRQFLNVAVWPDGFDAARRLRDAAIDLGFEFTLTPVPAGLGVPFNAASGVQ